MTERLLLIRASTIQYLSVIARPARELYDLDRERSPAASPDFGRPSASRDCCTALTKDHAMERKSELHLERQWELYRRSVAEGMPDSDYKTAVLAGIAQAARSGG